MTGHSSVSRVAVGGVGLPPGNYGEGGRTYRGQEPETRTHHVTQAWQSSLISTPCLHVFFSMAALSRVGCSDKLHMKTHNPDSPCHSCPFS